MKFKKIQFLVLFSLCSFAHAASNNHYTQLNWSASTWPNPIKNMTYKPNEGIFFVAENDHVYQYDDKGTRVWSTQAFPYGNYQYLRTSEKGELYGLADGVIVKIMPGKGVEEVVNAHAYDFYLGKKDEIYAISQDKDENVVVTQYVQSKKNWSYTISENHFLIDAINTGVDGVVMITSQNGLFTYRNTSMIVLDSASGKVRDKFIRDLSISDIAVQDNHHVYLGLYDYNRHRAIISYDPTNKEVFWETKIEFDRYGGESGKIYLGLKPDNKTIMFDVLASHIGEVSTDGKILWQKVAGSYFFGQYYQPFYTAKHAYIPANCGDYGATFSECTVIRYTDGKADLEVQIPNHKDGDKIYVDENTNTLFVAAHETLYSFNLNVVS